MFCQVWTPDLHTACWWGDTLFSLLITAHSSALFTALCPLLCDKGKLNPQSGRGAFLHRGPQHGLGAHLERISHLWVELKHEREPKNIYLDGQKVPHGSLCLSLTSTGHRTNTNGGSTISVCLHWLYLSGVITNRLCVKYQIFALVLKTKQKGNQAFLPTLAI